MLLFHLFTFPAHVLIHLIVDTERHWLQSWLLRIWIHENYYELTIKSGTGQHLQFLRCFPSDASVFVGLQTNTVTWTLAGCVLRAKQCQMSQSHNVTMSSTNLWVTARYRTFAVLQRRIRWSRLTGLWMGDTGHLVWTSSSLSSQVCYNLKSSSSL